MKFQDTLTPITGTATSDGFMALCSVDNFLTLTKTPVVQRNHDDRVNKGQVDHFENVLPQHRVVSVGIYTGESFEYEGGEVIKPGDALVVDGNTRKCYWQRAVESEHPMVNDLRKNPLVVCVKDMKTPLDIEMWYETFDSNGQIKKSSHAMQSAAHLSGVDEGRIMRLSTLLNRMVKSVDKKSCKTEVELRSKKVMAFGVEHINAFYDAFEPRTTKTFMSKSAPFLAAYRALRAKGGKSSYIRIDWFFDEILTGQFSKPLNSAGEMCVTTYLNNLLMQQGSYSFLNPKASADRIFIVAGLLYHYGMRVIGGNLFVPINRKPVSNSQAGADKMRDLFNSEMTF
ncbi:hypothetical protein CPT_Mydo_146 [Proteus phage Mydo]|jgi:hypothetical protein|uniref:Uncharacterized protein n=1 Tax=Proteus phage Mydo TaxID=2483610 RepID=A0A3G8F0R5_9CAUD|nr:hypothetical protein HWB97_gp146 [Proteus phage Mydo]AZF87721.1 hypothetical protein CPT_Mydo_146 [Proteus phage Mydo]